MNVGIAEPLREGIDLAGGEVGKTGERKGAAKAHRKRRMRADVFHVGAEFEKVAASGVAEHFLPFVMRLVEQNGKVHVASEIGYAGNGNSRTEGIIVVLRKLAWGELKTGFAQQHRRENVRVVDQH